MASKYIKCTKCFKAIINKQQLICSVCEKHFHLDCTNVSFQRFKIMTAANKKGYKCDPCCQKVNTSRKLSHSASPATSSFSEERDNITQRNKCEINISTQNSFDSLTEEEAENSSLSFSPRAELNRSLSTLRENYKEEIKELKQKSHKLQQKLEIAENEISNLVAENYALSKKLSEYELKVNQLTHICKTPKSTGIKKKAVTSDLKRLNISQTETPKQKPSRRNTIPNTMIDDEKIGNLKNLHSVSTDSIMKNTRNQVYIIGDEKLRGLSTFLIKSGLEERQNPYKAYAHIIPEATSTEILRHCNSMKGILSDDDIVILGFGGYDADIHKLHSNICVMLNQFSKVSVIMLPILLNPHFNEITLNYYIKLWTKHFRSCSHLDIDFLYFDDIKFKEYICDRVKLCIEYIEYKNQYLSYEFIRSHIRKSAIVSNQAKSVTHIKSIPPKKGTIPYYFRSKSICSEKPPNSIQSENETFFRV